MPKAYSKDLRERVVAAVELGERKEEVAVKFKVCPKTVYSWVNLKKATGGVESKKGYQNGHSHKITDWDKFRAFIDKNKGLEAKELVLLWEKETGILMSTSAMYRGLHRINYTSKKNIFVMQKQMIKSEVII